MGGGSYGYTARRVTNSSLYNNVSREEVFKQRNISSEMNIRDKVRECRNSSEHPNAYPIIIALDVTGSMGRIPDELIRTGLPDIMEKIIESGVKDPQVCFMAIGDQYTDRAPIQVAQFESSDDLMDKWLKTVYLEGGGGGNDGESYQFAWYAALYHTDCDWINNGKKGVLITIGDEPCHKSLHRDEIKNYFGKSIIESSEITTNNLLKQVSNNWDVYHINVTDYSGKSSTTQKCWQKLLNDHFIDTENGQGKDIPMLISGIILKSYQNQSKTNLENTKSTTNEHLL